jgi:DNA-3-methyladenine glycosylase II
LIVNNQPMRCLANPQELQQATLALCDLEPRFQSIVAQHGVPSLRASKPGLEGLLGIVCEQFLSLQAAAAIWARVRACIEPFEAAQILQLSAEDLLKLGLSRAKAKSFHKIAQRVTSGAFDFDGLPQCSQAEVTRQLCALPGVGPWTADIYLLSALGAVDAWPAGDLALRVAVQNLLALSQLPSIKEMAVHAAPWRPYRSVAARLLWSHYRGLKGLKQA